MVADVFQLFKVKAVACKATIELLTRDLVLQSGEILKVKRQQPIDYML